MLSASAEQISAGLAAEPYPRFSDAELAARRASLERAMGEHDVDHVVLYGAERAGSAIPWLTRWPVTREALAIVTPGEQDVLLVNFYNHIPNAARIATEADVRPAGRDAAATAVEELARRGARGRRIGLIGPLGYRAHATLAQLAGEVVPLDGAYADLRMRKSAEEIAWLRVACDLTDRGMRALRAAAVPGATESQLGDAVERGWVADEGRTQIHYIGVTSMEDPQLCAPAQWPARRRLQAGDVLACELSATFWDYTGQALRTFAVAGEPTPLYRRLHEVAEAAFDAVSGRLRAGATAAELVEAGALIDEAGFTIRDSLVHGFVGGLLPPALRTPASTMGEVPDFTFEAGMTVVVQPNVVTQDERAGVQLGELLLVGEDGVERLHRLERGFLATG